VCCYDTVPVTYIGAVLCSKAPFHLSRRGWGEFPVRIQLHFRDGVTKSVDIIHKLTVCVTGMTQCCVLLDE